MTAAQIRTLGRAYKDIKSVLIEINADIQPQQQTVFALSMSVGALETLLLRESKLEAVERVKQQVKELERA